MMWGGCSICSAIDRVEDEITEKTAGRAVLHRQEELRFGMAGGEVILLQN